VLFDAEKVPSAFYEGMLVSLDMDGDRIQARLTPFKQVHGRPGVKKMTAEERAEFCHGFDMRSQVLGDDEAMERLWREFCMSNRRWLLRFLYGHDLLVHRILARTPLPDCLYTDRKRLLSLSAVQCKSIREAILTILSETAFRGTDNVTP